MATHSVVLDTLSRTAQPISKSIANANPDAADGTLNAFATKLNALTTNNLITATRVVKTNLDELEPEPEPVEQTTPTLTLAQTSIPWSQIKGQVKLVDINYTGDGTLYVDNCLYVPDKQSGFVDFESNREFGHKIVYVDGAPKLFLTACNLNLFDDNIPGRIKGKVLASETAASAPVEVEFTITNA